MKLFLAGALCASAICGAVPALAQPYGPPPAGQVQPGHALREQLQALEQRIQDGIRVGQIDRGEADRALREVGSIRHEEDELRARGGGQLSDLDRGRLQERLDNLGRSIHWMREHGPVAGLGGPPPVVAGPPAYQPAPYQQGVGDWPLERREAWLQERINRGRADGTLNRREGYRAQMALNDIKATQARMMRHSHGRLRDGDREMLNQRLSRLSDMVRGARRDDTPPWVR
jgi:hypothetical protein